MGSLSTTRVLLIGLVAVALASFLPLGVSGYILGLLTIAYYFGVFAMAWDLLFGFAGEVNFGPTFLIGTGAYTAGILDNLYQPPIWLCVAAGALAAVLGGVINIAGVRTPANELFTAIVCWIVIAFLWLLVNRTRAGKAVLAASMNPRGVTLLGIELPQIYIAVWAIYGVLIGVAGVLLGMFLGVSSYSVGPLTASAFSIVVLGGLGSVSGALIAAYVVGYLETMTAYLISPAYRTIPALLLLVVVMYVRPRGLLGRR